MKYRPEIDGLRAIAVLPVLLFHASASRCPGGFAGVDIFFVISGYLIAAKITSGIDTKRFSLHRFYEKRARRLLPALYFVIFASIPLAYWMYDAESFRVYARSLLSIVLYVSNFNFWIEADYFAPQTELKPFIHAWSLSVEEQFYFLFPITVLLLAKVNKKFWFRFFLTALVVAFGFGLYQSFAAPKAAYFLPFARAWEMLLGVCIALLERRFPSDAPQRRRKSELGTVSGLGLIFLGFFIIDERNAFPGWVALFPTIGTALIIRYASPSSSAARYLLSNRLCIGIGLISYSLYLWHQPMLAFYRYRFGYSASELNYLIVAVLSFLPAFLSWRFFESPFRNRNKISARGIWLFSILTSFLIAAFGFLGWQMSGFPKRDLPAGPPETHDNSVATNMGQVADYFRPNKGLAPECNNDLGTSPKCKLGHKPHILLWGDSFAMHTAPLLQSAGVNGFRQITKSSCAPILGTSLVNSYENEKKAARCVRWNQDVLQYIAQHTSIDTVVLSGFFGVYFEEDQYAIVEGQKERLQPKELSQQMEKTINAIHQLGKKVVVVGPPPWNGTLVEQCLQNALVFRDQDIQNCDFSALSVQKYAADEIKFLRLIAEQAPYLDLHQLLCNAKVCRTSRQGIPLYRDSRHLSVQGAILLGKDPKVRDFLKRHELVEKPEQE